MHAQCPFWSSVSEVPLSIEGIQKGSLPVNLYPKDSEECKSTDQLIVSLYVYY